MRQLLSKAIIQRSSAVTLQDLVRCGIGCCVPTSKEQCKKSVTTSPWHHILFILRSHICHCTCLCFRSSLSSLDCACVGLCAFLYLYVYPSVFLICLSDQPSLELSATWCLSLSIPASCCLSLPLAVYLCPLLPIPASACWRLLPADDCV